MLFVPIGSKGYKNEHMEWRISFSVGEILLIYSFTQTQLLCYALMNILFRDVVNRDSRCKDLICSFYIKNIIFWVSEETSLSIWRPDNFISCFMSSEEDSFIALNMESVFITLFQRLICLKIK